MEVTLRDIGEELGLSATTVSRSLRHDSSINPETRARVNEVARRMGYKGRLGRPRRATEVSASGNSLGLLLRHSSLDLVKYDANLMKMMAGIMAVMDENGMHLKVHNRRAHEQGHLEQDDSLLPPMIHDGECQGLIVHSEHNPRDIIYLTHRMPVVSMGRIYRELPIDAAVADNIQGVHQLVSHLAELGHRRLAWVGAYYHSSFMEERKTGFLQGCLIHGLEIHQHSFFGPEIYKKPVIHDKNALLAAVNSSVTGFVCGNDAIALAVIEILEAAGHIVPKDISVTGFDAWVSPESTRQVTSIDPHFFEIGKAAARLTLQRIAHPRDENSVVTVRGKLVARDTSGSIERV